MLLHMPLVAIRLGNPSEGNSIVVLMELFPNINYSAIQCALEAKQLPLVSQSKKKQCFRGFLVQVEAIEREK